MLDDYARDDFPTYLRLIAGLLPKDDALTISPGVSSVPASVAAGNDERDGESLFQSILRRAGLLPSPEEVSA